MILYQYYAIRYDYDLGAVFSDFPICISSTPHCHFAIPFHRQYLLASALPFIYLNGLSLSLRKRPHSFGRSEVCECA